MNFDFGAAKKAGYSDAEIADFLGQQSKFDVAGARQAGYTDSEIVSHLAPNGKISVTHDIKLPFIGKVGSIETTSTPAREMAIADMYARPFGSGVPKLFYELGGKVTDAASNVLPPQGAAALGYGTNVLLNAIPTFFTMTKGLPAPSAQEQSAQALASQRQAVLDKGRAIGLKVPPAQVNPSFTNRVLESAGGKSATAQQASAVNENVAYQVAQREAGLNPAQPINTENLEAARNAMAQPYRDIAALPGSGPLNQPPFKSAAQTLEDLKDARTEAKQLWAYYNRSQIPQALRDAKAATAKAEAIENALEAQAVAAGRPDLVEKLRQARTALAKNFTVERAMRGSNFEPSALSRLESRANVPLGGDLETIMQMYRDFPKAMNAPQVGGSVGVNQLLPYLGSAGGAAAGAAMGGAHGAGLGGMAGLVLGQTIPPAARSLILSSPYQSLFANVPQTTGNPALLRMLANPAVAGALYQRQ